MQFPRLSNSLKIPPFKATLVYLVYLLNSILVLASLAPEFRTPFPPFKFEFLKHSLNENTLHLRPLFSVHSFSQNTLQLQSFYFF